MQVTGLGEAKEVGRILRWCSIVKKQKALRASLTILKAKGWAVVPVARASCILSVKPSVRLVGTCQCEVTLRVPWPPAG